MRDRLFIIIAGAVVGLLAVILVMQGNPANMGFCIACFIRDIAGGLGLHRAAVVQFLRPEIMGLILGSFVTALFVKEFKPTGGSSPVLRFALGMLMMTGALIFLGCPLRLVLRLAGGDWNALIALPGEGQGDALITVFGMATGAAFMHNFGLAGSPAGVSPAGQSIVIISLIILAVIGIGNIKKPSATSKSKQAKAS